MKKLFTGNYKKIVAFVMVLALLTPVLAFAQIPNLNENLQQTGLSVLGGEGANRLPQTIGNVVKILLGLLGILFVLLIIWAGFMWMTASGDPGKVDKAKKIIYQSIIGVVIIFMAYAITTYVIDAVSSISSGS